MNKCTWLHFFVATVVLLNFRNSISSVKPFRASNALNQLLNLCAVSSLMNRPMFPCTIGFFEWLWSDLTEHFINLGRGEACCSLYFVMSTIFSEVVTISFFLLFLLFSFILYCFTLPVFIVRRISWSFSNRPTAQTSSNSDITQPRLCFCVKWNMSTSPACTQYWCNIAPFISPVCVSLAL